MKTLKDAVATQDDLIRAAARYYEDIAADLFQCCPEGRGHWDAANDHVSGFLYDHYREQFPKADFGKIARKALKNFAPDDRAETRRYYRRLDRAAARAAAPPKPPRVKKIKLTWWQEMGLSRKPVRVIERR